VVSRNGFTVAVVPANSHRLLARHTGGWEWEKIKVGVEERVGLVSSLG